MMNFDPLEFVGHGSETQLQVSEKFFFNAVHYNLIQLYGRRLFI